MAFTRKRSRRVFLTRRRHRGGKKLTPIKLLSYIAGLQTQFIKAKAKGNMMNNDTLFKEVKEVYVDNIPEMVMSDWITLLTKTPYNINLNSNVGKIELLTRLKEITAVFEYWLQIRKRKEENTAQSGFFRRFMNRGRHSNKSYKAREHAMIFLLAVQDILTQMPEEDAQTYVYVITPLIKLLDSLGVSVSVFHDPPFSYQSQGQTI